MEVQKMVMVLNSRKTSSAFILFYKDVLNQNFNYGNIAVQFNTYKTFIVVDI